VTGEISKIDCEHTSGTTVLKRKIYAHDSILLKLCADKSKLKKEESLKKQKLSKVDVLYKVPVTLSEPNVLILDMAQYTLDDGETQNREEILRIDKMIREKLGYPPRDGHLVQPYVLPEESHEKHYLKLCFNVRSETEVSGAHLALEHPEMAHIVFNGEEVKTEVCGYFVDKAIKKVKLPKIYKGENMLEIKLQVSQRVGAEWCYILGDFGVRVEGSIAFITKPVRELAFGDWSTQGLPFYAGNVTYSFEVEAKDMIEVSVTHFRNPAIRVDIDGQKKGLIAFSPYCLSVPVQEGTHKLELTAYGNRHNAFGAIHNANVKEDWFGPNAWRTEDLAWSYEYNLKKIGIMVSPEIKA
jgi:hypothetical protein